MKLVMKLVRLNAEGKSTKPICHMQSHFEMNVLGFVTDHHDWPSDIPIHIPEIEATVGSTLQAFVEMFGCTIIWWLYDPQQGRITQPQSFGEKDSFLDTLGFAWMEASA